MPLVQWEDWPLGKAANDSIALIETRIPTIDVVSVLPNERVDHSGKIVPVMDVGFVIPPDRSIYYVHPPSDKKWARLALHSVSLKANVVLSIFQGLRERTDIIPLIDPLPSDYPDGIVPASALEIEV